MALLLNVYFFVLWWSWKYFFFVFVEIMCVFHSVGWKNCASVVFLSFHSFLVQANPSFNKKNKNWLYFENLSHSRIVSNMNTGTDCNGFVCTMYVYAVAPELQLKEQTTHCSLYIHTNSLTLCHFFILVCFQLLSAPASIKVCTLC